MSQFSFDLFIELDKFRDIVFHDSVHSYYFGTDQCTSVTSVINSYKKNFEAEKIAFFYGKKNNMTQDEVLEMWDKQKTDAADAGTHVHKYFEMAIACKKYEEDHLIPEEMIKPSQKFISMIKNKLIPIRSELVVGDKSRLICGMIDQIFYNKKAKQLQIWDYKTNKKFRRKSEYKNKMINGLEHLEECEMNTYSLQLGLYKKIIEKNTNIKLGDSYICWINREKESPEIIKTKPLTDEVNLIWDNLMQ